MKNATTFPLELEKVLLSFLKKNYWGKKKARTLDWVKGDAKHFAKGLIRLNELYTSERGDRRQSYFSDPVLRSGYLAYFFPLNFLKARHLIEKHLKKPKSEQITIVDVGSGPLSLSMAYLDWLAHQRNRSGKVYQVTIHAIETSEDIVRDGFFILKSYLKSIGADQNIKLTLKSLRKPLTGEFKNQGEVVLLFGNVLNEFKKRDEQKNFFDSVAGFYKNVTSQILIMEPALRRSARSLQQLRDLLLQEGLFVHAPCLHQEACPLNQVAKSDWCHFRLFTKIPDFVHELGQVAKLKKNFLLYSFLVLSPTEPQAQENRYVAISDQMPLRGGQDLIGCGTKGRFLFRQNNNQQREGNQVFSSLKRGDVFTVSGIDQNAPFVLEGRQVIKASDTVRLIRK